MNKITRISSNKAEANLTITWEDINKEYKFRITDYRNKVTLPGFRKGKAPMNVIEAKIGDEVLRDSCIEVMNHDLSKLIAESDKSLRPLPYSTPEIVDKDKIFPFKKEQDVNVLVHFDVTPEVKLTRYTGFEVTIPNVIISNEMIEAEVERYRYQNAIVKTKGEDSTIEKGDIVTTNYSVYDIKDDKKKTPKNTINDFTFTVGQYQNIYQFDDEFIGLKVGESKEIKLEDKGIVIDAEIVSIKQRELPEVNDEFAQDIKSEYKTVADLKNGIKKQMEEELDERLRETKAVEVCKKILEGVEIDLPESMIKYEIETSFARMAQYYGMRVETFSDYLKSIGQSKDIFEKQWRNDVQDNLKRRLIIDEVEKLESITADEEKVKALLEKEMPKDAKDEDKEYYTTTIKDRLNFEATIDFLLKNNKLIKDKKEITYEEFASGNYKNKESENNESSVKSDNTEKAEAKSEGEEKKEAKPKKSSTKKVKE